MLRQDLTAIETKSLSEADGYGHFTGTASTADEDLTSDVIEAGAFGEIVATKSKLFRNHDADQIVGRWHKFEQKGKRLEVEGAIILSTERGRETYALMKEGLLDGLSVGFFIRPGGATWDQTAKVRRIKSAQLME